MNSTRNWAETKPAGASLPPGGYVAYLIRVDDEYGKEYLKFEFDIAEGDYRRYYSDRQAKNPDWNWGGVLIRSYKESASGFFRTFLEQLEASNPGQFKADAFNNDERMLLKKYIGVILGEEEYQKQDGSIGKRVRVADTCAIEDIRAKKFTVPELKKYEPPAVPKPTVTYSPGAPGYNGQPDFDEIAGDDNLPF